MKCRGPRRKSALRLLSGLFLTAGASTVYVLPAAAAVDRGDAVVKAKASGWWHLGDTSLFLIVLIVMLAFIGLPYLLDVWSTEKRTNRLLDIVVKNQDLSEARFKEIIRQTSSGVEGLARALMAFSVIAIFAAALFYLLIINPKINSGSIVQNAMTALGTLLTAIVAFYFGTRSAQESRSQGQEAAAKHDTGSPVIGIPVTTGGVITDPVTGDTVISDTVTGEPVTLDTVSGDTVTGDTVTGDTVTGDTVTGDTVTGDTVSGATVSGDTVSGDTEGGPATVTGDPVADDAATDDTATDDAVADDTAGSAVKDDAVNGDPVTGGADTGAAVPDKPDTAEAPGAADKDAKPPR